MGQASRVLIVDCSRSHRRQQDHVSILFVCLLLIYDYRGCLQLVSMHDLAETFRRIMHEFDVDDIDGVILCCAVGSVESRWAYKDGNASDADLQLRQLNACTASPHFSPNRVMARRKAPSGAVLPDSIIYPIMDRKLLFVPTRIAVRLWLR